MVLPSVRPIELFTWFDGTGLVKIVLRYTGVT
jgi:hypothetical protein